MWFVDEGSLMRRVTFQLCLPMWQHYFHSCQEARMHKGVNEMRTIIHVTDETIGNLRIGEIINQSRENNVVWIFAHDHFKTVLWNGLAANDFASYRSRINAIGLDKIFIGITDKNEIWFYAGIDITWLLTIIKEKSWVMITDADTGTFDGTELTMTTYLIYPAVYTDGQVNIATYLFQILTEGMIVPSGVVHWFVSNKKLVTFDERYGYVYCEGQTLYANLPGKIKTIVFFRMIEGKNNLVQIGNNDEIYNSVVNPDLRFNWIETEATTPTEITLPIDN